jgi:predicted dehydrogenase
MNLPPRAALVGCGWFANAAHIPALRRLERNGLVELVALCSRSEESLSRASRHFGSRALRKYRQIENLLADPDVDLVDLVLPIGGMPRAIQSSLRAGKHVISEKPCAPSVAASLDLLKSYASLDEPPFWAVAENWRFKNSIRIIENIVKSGAIGEIFFADFRHVTYVRPGNLGWRGSPDYAGGHLLDSGVHFAALLRRVAGEVETVSALASQRQPYLPPADSMTAVMRFATGAEGTFRLSFAAREPDPRQPGLIIIGSQGALYANFLRNWIRVHDAAGKRFIKVPADGWVQGGVYELLAHCLAALRTNAPSQSSPSEALRDVAVIEAMLKSSRIGKPIGPSSLYPPLHGAGRKLATYNGVWTFKPRHIVECNSIDDVRSAVREGVSAGLRVRTMGMGSSWAPELLTRDVCLKLAGLNRIHNVDTTRKTVLLEAGVRLGDLTRKLASHGLSLASLSFFPDVTVGGAVASGTHGTSPKWGTLSDFVQSMKVVLASGEIKEFGACSPAEELLSARVAVGMLGVIVELELQAVDMPWVRFCELHMDLPTFLARRRAITSQYEHVWAHWTLGTDQIRIECLESRPQPSKGFHPYILDDRGCWHPPPSIGARSVSRAGRMLGRARSLWQSASRSRSATMPESEGDQVWVSMQYGVLASQIATVVDRIRASEFARMHSGRILELKFLKGEERSYLGPNADGDSILLNFWWLVDESVKHTVFDLFERDMKDLHARPHWGKLHRVPDIRYMAMAYPRWNAFEAVRSRLDPGGTFSIFAEHRP